MSDVFRSVLEWLDYLGWSRRDLARNAGIDPHTAGRAADGETISPQSAQRIARALSEASGSTVNVGDIRGMIISR
jgi:hypothetical protein